MIGQAFMCLSFLHIYLLYFIYKKINVTNMLAFELLIFVIIVV